MLVNCFESNGNLGLHSCGNPFLSQKFSISRSYIPALIFNTRPNRINGTLRGRRLNLQAIIASLEGSFDSGSPSGGILVEDLEFKPSFSECLKAMESARTVRDKKNGSGVKIRKMKQKGITEAPQSESQLATQDGLLDETDRVRRKEGLSMGKGKNQEKRGKRLKNERESTVDAMAWRKKRVEIIKGEGSKYHNVSSESQSKGGTFAEYEVENEQQRTGVIDSDLSDDDERFRERGINQGETSLDVFRRNDSEGSRRKYNSRGKPFHRDKVGVGSNYKTHGGPEGCDKSKKNLDRVYDCDDLEVERVAFKIIDEADDVIGRQRVSQREMEERIEKLARLLNGADIDIPEWIFSKMMRSARIKFTDHCILRVIQKLGKLGNWRRVLQVIEWLQRRERFKSHKLRYIYTAALDALGKARRPVEALNVFHSMLRQMSSYPDLVAYHSIAVTLGQAGHMKELFDVIDIMGSPPKKKFKTGTLDNWDPRLKPDIVIYNAVLNACIQRRQLEGAFWVLQQLKQQDLRPSSTTYGLVMEVMFVCGKHNLVHEFFRKVQKSSMPNALTYRVLVNTLSEEGKPDEAVSAVEDMERRGMVGSAALYYDLARCLCSVGRCHEALMQIEKICKVANKPLVVTYTGLIQACIDSGNIQDGSYIFQQMEAVCSPNLVTYNIMLRAYAEHGMIEAAKQLFEKMSENTNRICKKSDYKVWVIPDIYTFNTMLNACFAEKIWDYFDIVYRKMLHHGYHFNVKRHLRMVLEASRAGKEELLELTWNHLVQTDRIPPPPLVKERFCTKLEKDDYAAALSCVTSNPLTESYAFSKMSWLSLFKENAQRFSKDQLQRLIGQVSTLISSNDMSNSALQNLIQTCKEFCSHNVLKVDDPQFCV